MKLVLFILPLIILISCEELYNDPPINTTNSVVVVEGVITDTLPPYRVRLSYSAAYNSPYQIIIPISGAQVSIIDNLGSIELLKQGNNGIYSSSKTGMRGIIGRSYKLKIILKDKTSFESDFLALYPSPSIDSLYAEIGQVQSISTDGLNKIVTNYGLNLYVNVNPLSGQDYYYKFKTFSIQLIHQGIYPQGKAPLPDGLPPQYTRYKWNTSDLNIQKNLKAGTATNIIPIKGLFVGFVSGIDYTYNSDTTDMPVNDGAIITAELQSVPSEIYQIFTQENNQSNQTDSLFDPIPTQLSTNIKCTSNSLTKVFGYFTTMSVTKKYKCFYWADGTTKIDAKSLDSIPYNIPSTGNILDTFKNGPPSFWIFPKQY